MLKPLIHRDYGKIVRFQSPALPPLSEETGFTQFSVTVKGSGDFGDFDVALASKDS